MNLIVKHNGVDISDKIKLTSCKLFDRLGGQLDNIVMTFPYSSLDFEINRFDTLEVKVDDYSTGIMFIDGCDLSDDNRVFTLNALSFLPSKKIHRSRIWNHVTLYQLINDAATNCGLKVKLYDITNYSYEVVSQVQETDLHFLSMICLREGYSVKVDNGYLIIFNDYSLEHNYEPTKIKSSETSSSRFKRSVNGLKAFTVSCYNINSENLITATAKDDTVDGGYDCKVETLSSIGEAERFAKGYLRSRNKNHVSGIIVMNFNTNVSAGTVVDLEGFEEWDGKYIVSELMHDVITEKTYITVRNTLPY